MPIGRTRGGVGKITAHCVEQREGAAGPRYEGAIGE
jgi:hypothetical protein